MKKLLFAILCTISCYSYAEVNRELYNNYLIFYMPEVSPHSIPIKLQSISSNVIPTKKVTSFDKPKFLVHRAFMADKVLIKSSHDNGLIMSIETEWLVTSRLLFNDKSVIDYNKKISTYYHKDSSINYDKKTRTPFIDNQKNSFISKLIFNQNNLISHTGSTNYIYDKNNYITSEINNHDKYKGNTKYDYTNYGYLKSSCYTSNGKNLSTRTKEYFYDNDNRLTKVIEKSYSGENVKIKSQCDFSDYNEYGDWTIAKCAESDDDVYIEEIKRELEYQLQLFQY